jgi:hypothetical protein
MPNCLALSLTLGSRAGPSLAAAGSELLFFGLESAGEKHEHGARWALRFSAADLSAQILGKGAGAGLQPSAPQCEAFIKSQEREGW